MIKNNNVPIKPTNLQLLKGLTVSIIESLIKGEYSDAVVPDKVGKYYLVQKVNKENMLNGYAVGIYKNNGEKVFIKTWRGKIRNFGYYDLMYEYLASRIIYKKLESYNLRNRNCRIRIPKPIKYISSQDSFSLVFEFVEGKTLTTYTLDEKAEVIANIMKVLSEISKTFTEKEKNQLFRREKLFYILSLPIISVLTVVSNPKSYKIVFKAFIECLKTFNLLNKSNLRIAHRDISTHNILINKQGIYVIDWSRAALTVPDYDITYLSLRPELNYLTDLVSKKVNSRPNNFLKNYILIHGAQSFGTPEGYDNFYERQLYKLYA